MHIIHALFSDKHGGLEQAFVNYSRAILAKAHQLTLVVNPGFPYMNELPATGDERFMLSPKGYYDVAAIWQFRRKIKSCKPDVVIAHNSRAVSIARKAMAGLGIPLVGVSHSYKTKRMMASDFLIVLTDHMRRHFIEAGVASDKVFTLANMIEPVSITLKPMSPVPVIGAIGRIVEEKGFQFLLLALAELRLRGELFKALIAGEGDFKERLLASSLRLGLDRDISWLGWVSDKSAFYQSIDIAVVPSMNESFGLTVLEAMAYGTTVIASRTPGPESIIRHGEDGLLVPPADYFALANAIQWAMHHRDDARILAEKGMQRVRDFSPEQFANNLDGILRTITSARS